MKVYKGKEAQKKSWQNDFVKETKCIHCGEKSKLIFTAFETGEGKESICNMYKPKKGELWLHDSCAVAVYLCPKCLKTTSKINQA